jgi:hypothetical protein
MTDDAVADAIGSSFLNRCFETVPFFDFLDKADVRTAWFSWSAPYPLVVVVLLVLIILPSIFINTQSLLKIARIYNSTRLGVMFIFHQIAFAYSVAVPLNFIVYQGSPCIHSSTFSLSKSILNFPSSHVISCGAVLFAIAEFMGFNSVIAKVAITLFLAALGIAEAGLNLSSVFQAACAIPLVYILHFIGLRIPFRFRHIENGILALFTLAGMLAGIAHGAPTMSAVQEAWFSWVVIGIDEIILLRHAITRKGFKTIERAGDISWVVERAHAEAVRLLNSEEETEFPDHCRSDMTTSVLAFAAVFVGVLVRRFLRPRFFTSAT